MTVADPPAKGVTNRAHNNNNGRDVIKCVSFNPRKRILAAGTQFGRVCLWRFIGAAVVQTQGKDAKVAPAVMPSENDWESLASTFLSADDAIASLTWSTFFCVFVCRVTTARSLTILGFRSL